MILLATGVPGVAQRPWEPQMGANAIGRLQTQPDPLRMSMQVKGSPFELSPTATDTRKRLGLP